MSSHHGNTPAAWSAVVVGLVGVLVGAIGLLFEPINMPIFWVGVVITLASIAVYGVMAKMGYNS
ncbi:HGxxPAAW family protein [Nocardioides sp. GY 10127]|uniref:HGxxPAAW family protein n=1 Tax=Nocardioides sp. GY 10127 TaxID=2569762 RepID=UPI0010A78E88|nr:HGxxPAAW family protein [Nocardioides sp. GY 10127]TIC81011.1 hypothetical protein E8D37_14405 [Nocardioides sp. GY 10127]